ncbi:hypothetical protein L1887_14522 [Cichorium endivia]|nr:hypothetical protein L1887_14522 [Cichorium endivia]
MEGNPSSHACTNPTNTNTISSDAGKGTKCLNGDMAWEWGEWRDPLKKGSIWCTLFGKKVSGGITRLKQHLTNTGGQVTGCPNVTVDIQKRVMASIKEREAKHLEKKRNIEILRSNTVNTSDEDEEEEEVDVQEVSKKRNVSKKNKFVTASNVRGPLDTMLKTKQITLDKNNPIKEKVKMNSWDKIATWAYSVGLSFNAVRDENFEDMINAIGEYGRGMPAPPYHNIRVTLMKKHLEDMKKIVDSFRPHWEEYRCCIMSDFWTNGKGRCLINFLVNCPLGTVFLKSVDASEHVKNAQLIVEIINKVIEEVGEANIVQFITDNGSNFKATGKILEEQHPKLFWTPCATHCVNLMIGDIGDKIPKIKTGYYLNPAIFHGENSKEIQKNRDIATGFYVAIDRLFPDNDENDKLRQELNLYIDSIGQFGTPTAIRGRTYVAPWADLDERVDTLVDVDSEEAFIACD